MDKAFLTVLNMSLTGSFVIAAICLARFPLAKAPKIFSYCLWAAAGFRLVFPFAIESVFSLIPFKAQAIPADIITQHVPRIDSGLAALDNMVSGLLPAAAPQSGVYPLQTWAASGAALWLVGLAVMLCYGLTSYVLLKRRLRGAVCAGTGIMEAANIQSPFVLGLMAPKIYIPEGLSAQERSYIILHEQTHIRRRDHIIKCAAYLILSLHWFNPLAWAAFLLMGVDMEMSCDECVLKTLGGAIKKDYSLSLLSLATARSVISGSPLAFGEDGVKRRIQNVLMFKKAPRLAVALSLAFVTALSLGFAVSRAGGGDLPATPPVFRAETGAEHETDYADSSGGAQAASVYTITGYYDDEGKFAAPGLALPEQDSARMLTVSGGDILVLGERRYEVTAEALTLACYTQPSLDQVLIWWGAYLDSWAESGKVRALI